MHKCIHRCSHLDVGWEMRIHKLHAVFEALGHAINHVLDVTAGCLDDRQLLGLSEPLLDLQTAIVNEASRKLIWSNPHYIRHKQMMRAECYRNMFAQFDDITHPCYSLIKRPILWERVEVVARHDCVPATVHLSVPGDCTHNDPCTALLHHPRLFPSKTAALLTTQCPPSAHPASMSVARGTLTVFSFGMHRSTDMCLKLLVREPRGPVTLTTRDFTSTVTAIARAITQPALLSANQTKQFAKFTPV